MKFIIPLLLSTQLAFGAVSSLSTPPDNKDMYKYLFGQEEPTIINQNFTTLELKQPQLLDSSFDINTLFAVESVSPPGEESVVVPPAPEPTKRKEYKINILPIIIIGLILFVIWKKFKINREEYGEE